MREIKFRAWDAEQNKMIETFDGKYQIHVNEEDGTLFCGGYMSNGDWNEPIMMQFTGLYDENRNEVFEGDIIHSDQWNPNAYKVVFLDGEFCFVSLNGRENPYTNPIHYVRYFKVIGNIYENPELL